VDRIWAPWRYAYVSGAAKSDSCPLCSAHSDREGERSLVVHTGAHAFVVMNLYPYNAGHVMVAPIRHLGRLTDATPEELAEIMELTRRLEGVLTEAYRPDGINIGMNLGRSAGAGIADHIHLHVVPRWTGDTNFMTTLSGTRVISEDPWKARDHLRGFFPS
jgi:ATP adenylyltransferase